MTGLLAIAAAVVVAWALATVSPVTAVALVPVIGTAAILCGLYLALFGHRPAHRLIGAVCASLATWAVLSPAGWTFS